MTFTGAAGKTVHGWIVRPPDFDPAKYPLLVLIHGGPQGVWNDSWTFRWNAQVFAAGLRRVRAEPARLHRLGPGVRRRREPRLGRARLRGHHEGHRLRGSVLLRRPHGGRRRVVRRVHDQLDRGPHRPVQGARVPRRHLRPAFDVRLDRGAVVHGLGVRRAALGAPGGLLEAQPRGLREELQDADVEIHGELDYRVPLSRGWGCSPLCGAAFRPGSWSSRTRTTGCRSRPTRCAGTRKCSTGWVDTPKS